MKHKFTFLLTVIMLSPIVAFGQSYGVPKDIKECIGQDVFFKGFYDNKYYSEAQRKAYVYVKGKYKLAAKVKEYKDVLFLTPNTFYHIVGPVTIDAARNEYGMGTNFYHFISNGVEFYLPSSFCADISFRDHVIKCSYWEKEFSRYQEDYAYVDTSLLGVTLRSPMTNWNFDDKFDKNNLLQLYGRYYFPVEWISFEYDTASPFNPVKFKLRTNTADTIVLLCKQVEDLKISFKSKSKIHTLIEKNTQDSPKDHKLFLGKIKKPMNLKGMNGEMHLFKAGDNVAYIGYSKSRNSFLGLYLGNIYTMGGTTFAFQDPSDSTFLIGREEMGFDIRMKYAKEYDSIAIITYKAKQDSIEKVMRSKELFIMDANYAFGEHSPQSGISIKVYNCYSKQIKYIDISLVPYNKVGDIQVDYFGNKEKKVQCIGPISPEETGIFEFSDIYWDEYNVIELIKMTQIKITFMDGTTKNYSGVANVKKHALKMELGY